MQLYCEMCTWIWNRHIQSLCILTMQSATPSYLALVMSCCYDGHTRTKPYGYTATCPHSYNALRPHNYFTLSQYNYTDTTLYDYMITAMEVDLDRATRYCRWLLYVDVVIWLHGSAAIWLCGCAVIQLYYMCQRLHYRDSKKQYAVWCSSFRCYTI